MEFVFRPDREIPIAISAGILRVRLCRVGELNKKPDEAKKADEGKKKAEEGKKEEKKN